MAEFDWYAATVRGGDPGEVVAELVRGLDLVDARPGKPMHGFEDGAEIVRGDRVLARVWWGGNPGVHIQATGENAREVSPVVRTKFPSHRVSRVDACTDWVQGGLFDQVAAKLIGYATANGISINQQGDWCRGEARTLYLGSKHSPVRVVLYEKGYESGGDLNWVRLEVRVRPKGDARAMVALWEPRDCYSASPWLVEALSVIGWEELEPQSVGTVWRPSDAERARAAMLRQYGATLRGLAVEVGGWQQLGDWLGMKLATTTKRDEGVTV